MNRRWSVSSWGTENLEFLETALPAAGPGEVLVQFTTASLNYRDLLVVRGHYNPKFPLPLVPGSDAFGEIVATGPGTDESLLHRRVLTVFAPRWRSGSPDHETLRDTLGGPRQGVFQNRKSFLPSDLLVLDNPSALTPTQWSTLPCAGVTAWAGLVDHAKLKPGQTVVLIGTGGVSIFGLQIAKMLGARVLLLSSSAEKRARALEMGADEVADYRSQPNWSDWVLELTKGRGADVVLETGGAGTLAQSIRAVKVGGHISLIGVLAGFKESLNLLPLLMKAITVRSVVVGHRNHLKDLVDAYLQSGLGPVVDRTFSLSSLPEALQRLATGQHFGKICLEMQSETPKASS